MSQRYLGGFNDPGYDPLAANVTTGVTTVQNSGVFTTQSVIEAVGNNAWVNDPYFNNTSLLLQADGFANGSQNNTFIDSSANNAVITRSGSPSQGSFNPYLTSQWSFASDNVGDYVTVPSSTALTLGTGNFTIEFWVYLSAHPTQTWMFDQRSAAGTVGPIIYATAAATNFGFGSTNAIISTTFISPGVWTHVAVSKASGTTRLFVNGVQAGANYTDANNYVAAPISLGRRWDNVYFINGYMSNVRVLKGTALYTTTFVPPANPLTAITNTALLTFQDPEFKDNSINNAVLSSFGDAKAVVFNPYATSTAYTPSINSGSINFTTKTDFLSTPATAANRTFTGDFTLEAWVYPTDNTITFWGIYDARQSGATAVPFQIGINPLAAPVANQGRMAYYNGAFVYGTTTVYYNRWTHVAWVRVGTTMTFYVNGVAGGTATVSGTQTGAATTNPVYLGSKDNGLAGYGTVGYITDFRIVNGVAVYTSNFTPPTQALTATQSANVNGNPSAAITTETALLLNGANAGIYDATGNNVLTTVGNTQVSTVVKKYGSGSIFFDGTGDYLTAPNTQLVAFGTSNFTIELWAYVSTIQAGCIVDTRISSTSTAGIAIQITSAYLITITINNVVLLTTSIPLAKATLATWSHLAVVKASGTINVYIDGQRGSVSSGTSVVSLTDNFLTVGTSIANRDATTTNKFIGYMDDLRITNGVARYAAPYFTPPPRGFAKQ